MVGGVEARLGPEVAGRQRAERLRDTGRKVVHRAATYPAAGGYAPVRARRHALRHPNPLPAALCARATPRKVGIYACGPTVYARVHVGQRAAVHRLLPAQALPGARGLRRDAGRQRHRHQRQDLRRRAGRGAAVGGAGRRDGRSTTSTTPTGSGSGARTPSRYATQYVGQIVELIERLIEGGSAYAVYGDVYFRVRTLPRLRRALAARRRPDGPGRGRRGRDPEGGPARLRALEGVEGGRGHLLGRALGPRPAGLAHRVLGDGRGAAGRRVRHPRRRHRPRLPAPRERGGADAGRARQAAGPDLDAQRDARARRRRRWPSPSATSAGSARCSTTSAPRCSCCS